MVHDNSKKVKKGIRQNTCWDPRVTPFGPRESSTPGRYPRCLTLPQEKEEKRPTKGGDPIPKTNRGPRKKVEPKREVPERSQNKLQSENEVI